MHSRQFITRKINVEHTKLWEAIAALNRLDVWFPIIASCTIEGDGVGARRTMTTIDGGHIIDHIEHIDPQAMRLVYLRTKSRLPVTYYKGTVEVFPSFDSLAVVVWTIDFESTSENSKAVAAGLQKAIGDGLEGMEQDLLATAYLKAHSSKSIT